MKNLLLLGLCLLFAGCSGGGSSVSGLSSAVSGTINDTVTAGQTRPIKLFIDNDTDKTNGSVHNQSVNGDTGLSFSFSGVANGSYFFYAWKDLNSDGVFNSGDSFTSNVSFTYSGSVIALGTVNLDTIKP